MSENTLQQPNNDIYSLSLSTNTAQYLANLAITDAAHDKLVGHSDEERDYLNKALPIDGKWIKNEDTAFEQLFSATGLPGTGSAKDKIENLTEMYTGDIGITGNLHNYSIQRFPMTGKESIFFGLRGFYKDGWAT